MNDLLKHMRETAGSVGRCLEQDPRIRTVVVFGSVAYGAVTSRSDIDLWALCDPEIPEEACRDRLLSGLVPNWKLNAFGKSESWDECIRVFPELAMDIIRLVRNEVL